MKLTYNENSDTDFEFLSDLTTINDMNEYVDQMLKNISEKEMYIHN